MILGGRLPKKRNKGGTQSVGTPNTQLRVGDNRENGVEPSAKTERISQEGGNEKGHLEKKETGKKKKKEEKLKVRQDCVPRRPHRGKKN